MEIDDKWMFEDYPIEVYLNKNAGEKSVTYGAKITNWVGMVGHGETKEDAQENLRNRFNLYKESNKSLPSPGAPVPLKFASDEKIKLIENFATDFFEKIFSVNYYNGFYSDVTCLQNLEDFIVNDSKKPDEIIIQRVKEHYNVDITNIYYEPLWIVLKMLGQ